MPTEMLRRPSGANHPEDGELLGEGRAQHPTGYREHDDIVDAEIVDDPNESELVTTKYPAREREDAGAVEQRFTPEDWAKLEKGLAQEALKPQPPATQNAAQPTKLTFVSLDQTHDAEAAARRIAEQKVKERAANIEGNRFTRKAKEAWANFTVPFTYQKARREALNAIVEAGGDIYANVDTTDEKWETAHGSVLERLQSDVPEALHRGERAENLEAKDGQLASDLKDLIRQRVNGELDDEALREEKVRLFDRYREQHGTELLGKGLAEVDNLLPVVDAVVGAVEHGESLEAVLENMELRVGESRAGVRQEQRKALTDRVVDKLHTSKLSTLVSPEMAGTVGAAVGMIGHIGTSKTVSKIAHATGLVGGAVGAVGLAVARERAHLRAERAHHNEAKAEGAEFDAGEKMEEFAYELAGANELTTSLDFESLDLSSREGVEQALERLGQVEARVELTDKTGKNLIKYDDIMDVAEQRWALDLARAQAKCQLRPYLDDPAMLRELGVPEDGTFDSVLAERVGAATDVLMEDVTAKDAAFKKWSRWQMAKAGAWGGASALTFGLVGSEVFAAMADKTTSGLEKLRGQGGGERETILAALAGKLGFGGEGRPIDGATSFADRSLGTHGTLTVPEGMEVQNNPDGTVNLSYGDMRVDNVPMEKDGSLSPEALARLREQGLQVTDVSYAADMPETKTVHGSLHEFMEANRSQTEHVTRVGWSDNDTVRPDQNELKIWWGGKDNNGIRPGGGYQFDISQMTAGGSSHDGLHENWKELAKNGELKMFISPSTGEQAHPFAVNISPDGKIDIPKDHPAAKFFSVHDGQARFDGKYAEVAQVVGENDKGATEIRPLATEVGTDTAKDEDYTYEKETKTETPKPAYNVRVVSGDGASLDYHVGPAAVPRTFAKPAEPRPVDSREVPPPVSPRGELERGGATPELEPAPARLEIEGPRQREIRRPRSLELEVAGRPEAPAVAHRERAALAAARPPRVWSPFWQGEIKGGGETPAIEAPAAAQEQEESERDNDVTYVEEAAREALKSGSVSVTEMERVFRSNFGAGGAYITVIYDQGRPVDYRVHVTDAGAERLKSMLNARQALEGQRRPAIEVGPATPELEA